MDVMFLVALLLVGAMARPQNGWGQDQQDPGLMSGGPGTVGGGSGPMGGGSRPMGGGSGQMGGGSGPIGGGSGPMGGGSGPMGGGSGPMGGGSGPMGGGSRPMGGGSRPIGGGSGPMGGGSRPMEGGSRPVGGGSRPVGGGSRPMGGGLGPRERQLLQRRAGPRPKAERHQPKNESSELMRGHRRPMNDGGSRRFGGRGSPPPVVPSQMRASDPDQTKGPFHNGNPHGGPSISDWEPDFPGWARDGSGSMRPLNYSAHRGGPHVGGPHGGGPHGGGPHVGGPHGGGPHGGGPHGGGPHGGGPHVGGPHGGGPHGGGPHVGGPHGGGPHGAGRPSNPNSRFIPLVKAENITLQGLNISLPLKEGENIFILPTIPALSQSDRIAPQYGGMFGAQLYIKIIYNPNSTQRFLFEFGVLQFLPSFLKAESGSDGDADI